MGEDPYAITNPIANSLFGTLLLLALDAVNFVGDITIKLFMYVYYAICDIVYGSKSVSDLLKNQPDEPILPIEPTEPVVIVEPAESGSPTTNELLMTVIANQNDMNTRLSKLEEKFKIHISGN